MKNSRFIALVLAALMLLSIPATAEGASEANAVTQAVDYSGKVVVLHTNDTHGGDVAIPGERIGTAGVAALKKQYEAAGATVILVSAGDAIQGEPIVNLTKGANAINFMNLAKYDLMVPGNHEFDWGTDNLAALSKLAAFPILCASITETATGKAIFESQKIFETKIGRIGFFGLTTPETMTAAHPDKIKGLSFLSGDKLYKAAQAQTDALRAAGCKYVICVGHLGTDAGAAPNRSDDVIANVKGIDVFIDGHSHSILNGSLEENKIGNTLRVSAGTKTENVGAVVLDGTSVSASLISAKSFKDVDKDVAAAIKTQADSTDKTLSAVFAKTEVLLDGNRNPGVRTKETNLGDFACDALLWAANFALGEGQVDAAITNGGGIRDSIKAGDISMKDIAKVFPFSNTVATVKLTGAQLLEILEAATAGTPFAVGSFPQVSGIEFTIKAAIDYENGNQYPGSTFYAPANPGSRIINIKVGGKALELKKTYTIATNDFTAAGGDSYYVFKSCKVYNTGLAMEDALVTYTSQVLKGVVTAEKYGKPAGRITVDCCPIDVAVGAWYYKPITTVIEKGFMTGMGGGYFKPDGSISRAMAVQALYNAEGKPKVEKPATFKDIPKGAWYADAAAWAEQKGLISGTDIGFEGDRNITRQELCKVMVDYSNMKKAKLTKGTLTAFTDASKVAPWAEDYVKYAVGSGLITGIDSKTLDPEKTASRAQLATIFTNYLALAA